jgi:hypothetical protein
MNDTEDSFSYRSPATSFDWDTLLETNGTGDHLAENAPRARDANLGRRLLGWILVLLSVPLFLGGAFVWPFLMVEVARATGIKSAKLCLVITWIPGSLLVSAGTRLAGRVAAVLPGSVLLVCGTALYVVGMTNQRQDQLAVLAVLGVFVGFFGLCLIVYGVSKHVRWRW